MKYWNRTSKLWAAGLLILSVQCALTYGLSREEYLPSPPPLQLFPRTLAEWDRSYDLEIEPAVVEALGPDDILSRNYAGTDPENALNLFVAYYKTQHRVRNAHDPKVCLPGSGWEPQESKVIQVPAPAGGESNSFPVNYYRIKKGDDEAVVLYWFQTHEAAVTQTEGLRLQRVFGTVLKQRSDMALVRIVAPVFEDDAEAANQRAVRFAQLSQPYVRQYFPPSIQGSSD